MLGPDEDVLSRLERLERLTEQLAEVVIQQRKPAAAPPEERPLVVGEPLPAAMGPQDLMRALGIQRASFFRHQAAGKFDRFLLPRPIGLNKFSGRLVQAYLDGGSAGRR